MSCFMCKSLSHFEFIFVQDMRVCSNFIDLHAAVQFSKHQLLKTVSFLHVYSCLPCQRLIDCRHVGLFWGPILFHLFVCLICAKTMLFCLL